MSAYEAGWRYLCYPTFPEGRVHLYEDCTQLTGKDLEAIEVEDQRDLEGRELCWTCATRVARAAQESWTDRPGRSLGPKRIAWEVVDERPLCGLRKGGRRSTVRCEKDEGHAIPGRTECAGRGKGGQWFFWITRDTETARRKQALALKRD